MEAFSFAGWYNGKKENGLLEAPTFSSHETKLVIREVVDEQHRKKGVLDATIKERKWLFESSTI